MKTEEYGWKTADGIPLTAALWRPDGQPAAAVALVHGMGEHRGRYGHVIKAFTDAGYAVTAFDLRGHGKSGGPRLYAPSYDAIIGDVDVHIEETRKRVPGVPVFLYGHSMGGSIVLYHALVRKPKLAGVIASSPGLGSGTPQPALKILFGRIMNRVMPTLRIPTGFPPEGISRDPAVLEATSKDPLFQHGVSVRLGFEIIKAGEWIGQQTDFPLPLLIMQGSADKYVDPALTLRFVEGLKGDVTFRLWEGCYHELHNEPVKEEVLAFIMEWIDKKRGRLK